MTKTKITNHQLFALVANFTIGTSVIAASSGVAALAKQDAWISELITSIIGLPFIWIYYYLGKLYPDKTLVEILILVLGKWFGWIVSAFFVLFVCFLAAAQVIFYVSSFMKIEYMTETPLYALSIILVAALVIGLLYGLEAIARSAEVFVIIVIFLFVSAMLLDIPNIKTENLFPVLEEGITPVFKGCLYLSSYMTWPLIVLIMVYPSSVNTTVKTRNSLFLGYLVGASINFICTIMAILVLGSTITARSQFPTYLLAKEIDVGIFTRIEGITAGAWILSEFVKIIMYFYAGVIGISQLFGLKDYKKIVLPVGLVLLVLSGVVYPDAAYQAKWDCTTWIPFISSFGAILPILLLIVSKIKNKTKKDKFLNRV